MREIIEEYGVSVAMLGVGCSGLAILGAFLAIL